VACRVLLADDHQIVRQGLRGLLVAAGHEVIGEASDGRQALKLARTLNRISPSSIFPCRAQRPGCRARNTPPRPLHQNHPAYDVHPTKVMYCSIESRGQGLRAQDPGGRDLITAIREISRGETYLSRAWLRPLWMRSGECQRGCRSTNGTRAPDPATGRGGKHHERDCPGAPMSVSRRRNPIETTS